MKIRVDENLCQGHGQCVMICPNVFTADEQGFAQAIAIDVPADDEDSLARAEASCPERAIQITR